MIVPNRDLKAFNTFGLPSRAEQYLFLNDPDLLESTIGTERPALTLGGGSNLLLLDRVPGLTLHVGFGGIQLLNERDGYVSIRVGAGVNWHQFVLYCIDRGWHGLENLALIPGTVGAAPVQNIGAYGLEVDERIIAVHTFEYGKGYKTFTGDDCGFSYRDSRFKRETGRYLITAVDFRLGGPFLPRTEYGAVAAKLKGLGYPEIPNPRQLARAVIEIRHEKLPSWNELGNSGSFFKNPIIDLDNAETLKKKYPDLPFYPTPDAESVKLPAGWLIDRAGWRGKRIGDVGCYERQALVIVNHGGATGREVLDFSQRIQADILDRYGIALEREVRVVGGSG